MSEDSLSSNSTEYVQSPNLNEGKELPTSDIVKNNSDEIITTEEEFIGHRLINFLA
jgi:hypothetical protein